MQRDPHLVRHQFLNIRHKDSQDDPEPRKRNRGQEDRLERLGVSNLVSLRPSADDLGRDSRHGLDSRRRASGSGGEVGRDGCLREASLDDGGDNDGGDGGCQASRQDGDVDCLRDC